MKLTGPQSDLLTLIVCGVTKNCAEYYRPAQALVRLGLIRFERRGLGKIVVATEEGIALADRLNADRRS